MQNRTWVLIAIIVVVVVALFVKGSTSRENYANPRITDIQQSAPVGVSLVQSGDMGPAPIPYNENVLPYPQQSNPYQIQSEFVPPLPCETKDILKPADLLPKQDPNSPWNLSNPPVNGSLEGRNYLESTALYGIDTVGSSLRNGNQQLRSDPYISPREVGPWNQSTIAPDTSHRYFEIGSS